MALDNKGTAVYIDTDYLPEGYSKPSVTKFTDHEYKYSDAVLNIAKSGVENADKATTFTQLVSAISTAVGSMVSTDFDTEGLSVSCYANLKIVYDNHDLAGVLYTNGAINYVCTVDIFVKTEAL